MRVAPRVPSAPTDVPVDLYQQQPRSRRLLVAVAGIPGSGKTTLAGELVKRLNTRFREEHPAIAPENGPIATLVPMDGYHLTRAQLDALPDPTTAHARRGAPFTFDAYRYLGLVRRLRKPIAPEEKSVWAPSFDHAVKDPVERGIEVRPGVRVVVFEGNYVGMEGEPSEESASVSAADAADDDFKPESEDACWAVAKSLMDEVWFVDVDDNVARRRLASRHVAAGIVDNIEDGEKRADQNDLPNGQVIKNRKGKVDELVTSHEDSTWAPEAQGGVEK